MVLSELPAFILISVWIGKLSEGVLTHLAEILSASEVTVFLSFNSGISQESKTFVLW